ETVASLSTTSPQHGPLYYFGARLWAYLFGDSRAALRSFGAVISVLQIPAAAWLSFELFSCPLAAFFTALVMSLSFVHYEFAQALREYSTWTLAFILSNIAFLKAMRSEKNSYLPWIVYGLSMIVSVYTFPLALTTLAGHALFVAQHERYKFTPIALRFAVA